MEKKTFSPWQWMLPLFFGAVVFLCAFYWVRILSFYGMVSLPSWGIYSLWGGVFLCGIVLAGMLVLTIIRAKTHSVQEKIWGAFVLLAGVGGMVLFGFGGSLNAAGFLVLCAALAALLTGYLASGRETPTRTNRILSCVLAGVVFLSLLGNWGFSFFVFSRLQGERATAVALLPKTMEKAPSKLWNSLLLRYEKSTLPPFVAQRKMDFSSGFEAKNLEAVEKQFLKEDDLLESMDRNWASFDASVSPVDFSNLFALRIATAAAAGNRKAVMRLWSNWDTWENALVPEVNLSADSSRRDERLYRSAAARLNVLAYLLRAGGLVGNDFRRLQNSLKREEDRLYSGVRSAYDEAIRDLAKVKDPGILSRISLDSIACHQFAADQLKKLRRMTALHRQLDLYSSPAALPGNQTTEALRNSPGFLLAGNLISRLRAARIALMAEAYRLRHGIPRSVTELSAASPKEFLSGGEFQIVDQGKSGYSIRSGETEFLVSLP